MSGHYAILVTVKLKPGMADAFRPHILRNAEAAMREEADCHQFQVMESVEEPDTFVFYEVYSNEAALAAHRETPHFKRYVAAAGEMIAERSVRAFTVLRS